MTVTVLDSNDRILTEQDLESKLIEPETYYQFMDKVDNRILSSTSDGESYAG